MSKHVFPQPEMSMVDNETRHAGGLTKRELLAAMCLQGMLSGGANWYQKEASLAAVIQADALIAALEVNHGG